MKRVGALDGVGRPIRVMPLVVTAVAGFRAIPFVEPVRAAAVAAALAMVSGAAYAQIPASNAFLDPGARTLYEAARARRDVVDRSITRYQTTSQERFSASLRALGRERLLYRRETAGRIDWRRGGQVRVEVLGAREVVPIVKSEPQVPADLDTFMPHLAYDRLDFDAIVRMDTSFVRDPFAAGAEAYYRFRSGDTTTIRLQDGRTVRLMELEVLPRRKNQHLLTGSFWIDEASHAIVQAVFRLSDRYDLLEDEDEADDVPGFLKPIELDRFIVTVDYGLWELRWWMPRYATAEGVIRIGSIVSMPVDYQLAYSEYRVEGDTTRIAASPLAARPDSAASPVTAAGAPLTRADSLRECRPRMRVQVDVGDENRAAADTGARDIRSGRGALRDSIQSARAAARAEAAGDTARANRILRAWERRRYCSTRYDVLVTADTASLLSSPYLPPTIYTDDAALISLARIEEIARRLENLAEAPWQLAAPDFAWGTGGPGLLRYNRVEGLSVGGRLDFDFGPLTADATARIGTADREPNAELGLRRDRLHQAWRLSAYHKLDTPDAAARPFSFANSLGALLFGRDNGYYHRVDGVALAAGPPASETGGFAWRLYGERQRAVSKETDFSVAHLIDSGNEFDPNIQAARADQLGTEFTLRLDRGRDPGAFRWGAEASARTETGTFDFVRPSALLRASAPVPFTDGGWNLAVEAGAGTADGAVPIQSMFFLGGSQTVRGYAPGTLIGDAFWRGRVELARGIPAARLVVFSDFGWAGPRDALRLDADEVLGAAGVGLSFMDGIIRLDLARAFRPPTGWRLELYVGGAL